MTEMEKQMVGKKVIVRSNVAGVHAGEVEAVDYSRQTVYLKGARRLWAYHTFCKTGSVTDVAINGLNTNYQNSIGAVLPGTTVIVNPQGLEIDEMTDKGWESVRDYV